MEHEYSNVYKYYMRCSDSDTNTNSLSLNYHCGSSTGHFSNENAWNATAMKFTLTKYFNMFFMICTNESFTFQRCKYLLKLYTH